MTETWRDRFEAAMKARGFTMRALSVEADLNPGFVFAMLKGEGGRKPKEPTVENLVKLCEILQVPMSRIVYGDSDLGAVDEILERWRGASPTIRQAILGILRENKAGESGPASD